MEDDAQPKPLDNEARVLLFRAVRELLFNVLKHAQASCTKVSMRRVGEHLQIIVEDNGVGFAPDKLSAASGKIEGFGLFSIRERLNYFGGRMEIESAPGEVTRVILSFPLQPDKKKRPSQHGDPNPRQGRSPGCGVEGSIPPAGKTPASLIGRGQLACPHRLAPGGGRRRETGLPVWRRRPNRPSPASSSRRQVRLARGRHSLPRYSGRNPILSFTPKFSIMTLEALAL